MAKRKNEEIMEKLSALKTSVPTKTRTSTVKKSGKESPRQNVAVRNKELDQGDLVLENNSAMKKISDIMFEVVEEFHLAIIRNWHRLTFALFGTIRVNLSYFMNIGDRQEKS